LEKDFDLPPREAYEPDRDTDFETKRGGLANVQRDKRRLLGEIRQGYKKWIKESEGRGGRWASKKGKDVPGDIQRKAL